MSRSLADAQGSDCTDGMGADLSDISPAVQRLDVATVEKKYLRAEATRAAVCRMLLPSDWLLKDFVCIMADAKSASGTRFTTGQVRRAMLQLGYAELAGKFSGLSTARRVLAHPAVIACEVRDTLQNLDWVEFLNHDLGSRDDELEDHKVGWSSCSQEEPAADSTSGNMRCCWRRRCRTFGRSASPLESSRRTGLPALSTYWSIA
jgi:hypothetical protein